jgi:hypothetical protein
LIATYLTNKVYEKRAWTRDEYVEACRVAWARMKYDPTYERKVLIDFSEPVTVSQLFGALADDADFVDTALSGLVLDGFENKGDIECIRLLATPRPTPGRKPGRVKISEAFRPATPSREVGSLESQDYLIALFDVLGFSNLVKERGSAALLKSYQQIVRLVMNRSYTAFGRIKVAPDHYILGGTYAPIGYTYFSDTIILWTTPYDTHVSPFLARCADLICEALRMRLPLRGAITFGEAVMHRPSRTYIGKAIVEANEIEKNQRWVGVTLGRSFGSPDFKEALSESLVVPLFAEHFKLEMPLTYPYLTLDWVTRWNALGYPDAVALLEELRAVAPEQNRIYWDNTISFVGIAPREDLFERRKFLRASGYLRLTDIVDLDVRPIHMRPIVLKVQSEPPRPGFTFTFPEPFTRRNRRLRNVLKTNILFIKRQDEQRLLDYVHDLGKREIDLGSADFIYFLARKNVEYIDVIMYEKPDETK